ncbi:probable guanine deaminase [[Candida] anglica]|uniref:Probable guanine deaminase n=1 Tax=[Candida] anglica TaxID=148631 RepID=A0ABP0ECQ8_9ASCO
MYTLYYGTIVHTPTISSIEININTLVGVNSNGTIDFIHKNLSKDVNPIKFFFNNHSPSDPIKEFKFNDNSQNPLQFFCPGFIDTHIHASQYPNLGIGIGVPLLDWLKQYTFPMEESFKKENLLMAEDVYNKVISRTLSCGTTCASYFTTIDYDTTTLFTDLLLKHGQRGFVGKVCMDHNEPYPQYSESFEQSIESQQKILNYIESKNSKINARYSEKKGTLSTCNHDHSRLVTPIITPRFAPVCSDPLLQTLGAISLANSLPIQTHIAENLKEVALMKELFPQFENYASVYDHYQLLTNRTILAHAVHLDDDECKIISERGCTISHCPTSNSFLSSGEAPIKKYLKHNINIALGTDLSGGFDSSILGIMKHSILVSHHLAMPEEIDDSNKLSIKEVMYMATQGGAKAVGLGDTIGTFHVGKQWDAQLIDLASSNSYLDVFEWQVPDTKGDPTKAVEKINELLGRWIFNGDDRNCMKVWVNGNLVVDKEDTSDGWVIV